MAGNLTNFAELELLDHLLGSGAYTMPTVYAGLSTTTITDPGTDATEPSGNSYARVATTGNWNAAASGQKSNSNAITFPTASGSWGTVTYFALYDASTAGNMLVYGPLTASKEIQNGDTASFSAGTLVVQMD